MPRPRTIDYPGVGQSGYTAGRREHDRALERDVRTHNTAYPKNADEDLAHELETDDRWTGRGGPIPEET